MFESNLFVITFNLINKDLPLYISLDSNNPFALENQNLTCWHIYQNPSFVIQQRHTHLALLLPIIFFAGQMKCFNRSVLFIEYVFNFNGLAKGGAPST
jgi:hypothetical protein